MTVTWVRRLSDGEELVIEEFQGSPGPIERDPREWAIDRRSRALSGDGPFQDGQAARPARE